MRITHPTTRLFVLALLLIVLVTACGGGNDTDDANTEDLPEARPLLEESVQRINEANSLELEMDISGYPVPVDNPALNIPPEFPLLFQNVRGFFQSPDRLAVEILFRFMNATFTADLIALDRDHYFRGDVTAGRWINDELIPGFSPLTLMSPEAGIPFALMSITQLEIVGREKLRGEEVFHLTGLVQASAVHTLTFGLIRSRDGELTIEVFINVQDRRVAQISFTDPPPSGEAEADATTWDISILDYNESISITAPTNNDDD
ncbi:MAG: LppX_LprAFG lipoprotein [Anaerolineae bacterium]|nr:LppX_LprAFG lipoprotein [Anaerolineae bacterium]